jgi:hypothetical protein
MEGLDHGEMGNARVRGRLFDKPLVQYELAEVSLQGHP